MAKFFDRFPTTFYDVQVSGYGYRYLQTNILFRVTILSEIAANASAYYDVELTDKDTMEILAEKVYGDPEWHWLIAHANSYTNPLFDWPMEYSVFNRFIESKYGDMATAASMTHHYTCRIDRKDDSSQTTDTEEFEVDKATFDSQPSYSYTAYTLESGTTIEETITYTAVSAYDYELEANEARRKIRLIRPEYLSIIQAQFEQALRSAGVTPRQPYYRSLRDY